MTYEELLTSISKIDIIEHFNIPNKWQGLNAFRAVVELHKPEHSIRGYRCVKCDEHYPCPTIQVIEKELNK